MELVLLSMLLLVLLLLLFGENFTKSYLWTHNLTHIIKSWLVVATMEIWACKKSYFLLNTLYTYRQV